MNFFYPTVGALAILAAFGVFVGRQNRDLLRARAYGEFFVRLMPLISTGVFLAGLPFVMDLARVENALTVFLVYIGGAALLSIVLARAVAPEERRATLAFRKDEPEKAASIYEELLSRRPLPRYYSALAAVLDASGDPHGALEAADRAVKLDPKLGVARYNRASVLAALGEKSRAREDLLAVLRSDAGRNLRRAAEEALEILEKS